MKKFVLSKAAKVDLDEIWNYIAADNVDSANKVLDALELAMVKLGKNPGIGHRRVELADKRRRRFYLGRCRIRLSTFNYRDCNIPVYPRVLPGGD